MAAYIGVDVNKKSLNIYVAAINKNLEISNNKQGFNELLTSLMKHYQDLSELIIVFEPIGGYEQKLR